jgi:formylglycine-generating enzyme required for sulfatase activity
VLLPLRAIAASARSVSVSLRRYSSRCRISPFPKYNFLGAGVSREIACGLAYNNVTMLPSATIDRLDRVNEGMLSIPGGTFRMGSDKHYPDGTPDPYAPPP